MERNLRMTGAVAASDAARVLADPNATGAERSAAASAAPELDRLREALGRVDRPDLILDWLKKAGIHVKAAIQWQKISGGD